jgi:uncharacterized membrane protein YkoI/protein tyrosine phosphatase (PTP) superfamily phosphohydrolase (DUF442 family)
MRLSVFRPHITTGALAALALVALLSGPALAQAPRERVPGVTNFGRVTEKYFRGGKVSPQGVENLYALGVRTIVDLRDEPSPGEPEACERLGIVYHKVPLSGHATPDDAEIARVLEIIEKAGAPVYVHCSAGKHRAGTVCALYRMRVQGWTPERAWAEQSSYGFGPTSEHPELFAYAYGAEASDLARGAAPAAAVVPVAHTDSVQTNEALSATVKYFDLEDVVERARKEGGSGDVLQIDLEFDVARSVATWDVTFSSGFEYEFDATTGALLAKNEKSPAKLAKMDPIDLEDLEDDFKSFQEIIRAAEGSTKRAVQEMELKHMKGKTATVYEVVLVDGTTLYYDAKSGSTIESL